MPATTPITYAALTQTLPQEPYVLSIRPSPSGSLLLGNPSPEIIIADPQSLQAIDILRGGHIGNISDICVDDQAIWSSGKDGNLVRWDERSRRPASVVKAFLRKTLPVLAVTASERDHLVIGGAELVSAEAHILFWDTRNTKTPAYTHSSTHSDDITHLSLLPSTSTFLSSSSSAPLPSGLLLSTSTDGLVALSNMQETDEDEAVLAAENWGQSIAAAGSYMHKGKMRVWSRSDMDGLCTWEIGKSEENEIQLQSQREFPSEESKYRDYTLPSSAPSVVQTAQEERTSKYNKLRSDYLIDVIPTLGISAFGMPITAVGTNDGDMILQHSQSASHTPNYTPSAYMMSGPGPSRGHKGVIRAIYHDAKNEAIYTGCESGVLSGWSIPSLSDRIRVGDPEIDDDGGDGREDGPSDDSGDEESEIESEDEGSEDGMDVDDDDEEGGKERKEPGYRYGPIIGRGAEQRKEKRKGKRAQPY